MRFLGSCNGLIVVALETEVYMTNPTTRVFTKVLKLRTLVHILDYYDFSESFVSGLSHHDSAEDYKVVLILRHRFAMVGSCKTKEWREVPIPLAHRISARFVVEFNSTMHFMVSNNFDNCDHMSTIAYFDPTCDEFRTFPAPEPIDGIEFDDVYGLGLIDENLCMGRGKFHANARMIKVLVMKEYGVKESWATAFVVGQDSICKDRSDIRELQFYSADENQRKVMIIHSDKRHRNEIFEYDRQTNNMRRCLVPLKRDEKKEERVYIEACVYFENLDHSPQGFAWEWKHNLNLNLSKVKRLHHA